MTPTHALRFQHANAQGIDAKRRRKNERQTRKRRAGGSRKGRRNASDKEKRRNRIRRTGERTRPGHDASGSGHGKTPRASPVKHAVSKAALPRRRAFCGSLPPFSESQGSALRTGAKRRKRLSRHAPASKIPAPALSGTGTANVQHHGPGRRADMSMRGEKMPGTRRFPGP